MATPPFNIAQTSPAPTDLVSSFPADEQSNRDIIESWLTILSDPATGLLRDSAIVVPLTLTQAAAGSILTLVSTDAGASTGPILNLYRNSASPAVSDSLGQLQFDGEDSAGNQQVYGAINVAINDHTSTSEDSKMRFFVEKAGALTETFTINETGANVVGTLTGDRIGIGGTAGNMAIGFEYSGANILQTLGSEFSTGNLVLGFAVKPDPAAANTFVSSAGNAAFTKGALQIGNTLSFWTAPAATIAIDAAVAMTEVFSVSNAGDTVLAGTISLPDGSATSPSITNTGDSNTGIYWAAADQLTFTTAGVARASFTTTQFQANVDLVTSANVTAASGTVTAALFSGSGASLTALNASNLSSGTVPSARVSGSYTGITGTGALAAGSITSGFGAIDVGADAISGGAISGTTGTFSGAVSTGILSASSLSTITVVEATAGTLTLRPNNGSAVGQLTIGTTGIATLDGVFRADAGAASAPSFSFSGDTNTGFYSFTADEIGWSTGGSFRGNLTVSGLNLGKSAANSATVGLSLGTDGQGIFTVASDTVLILNRTGSDGTVVSIRNDNVSVGTIEVAGATTNYNTTSDARYKRDFRAFDSGKIVDDLNFGTFNWIGDGVVGYGVLAQDALKVFPTAITGNDEEGYMADYSKFVPVAMSELKALRKRVAILEGDK